MRIDLTSRWSRSLFAAVVLVLAGTHSYFGAKAWLAEHWNASSKPELWQKAAGLEPGNADYWRHLGLYTQWDLKNGSDRQAIVYLQRAARIDSRSSGLWMDLAEVYQSAGDPGRAQKAYENAQADYPMSAEVAWRYGSFLLSRGNFSHGYAEINRALLVEPSLTTAAVAECWQANPNVDAILQHVLPAKSRYYLAAVNYFLSKRLLNPALAVWNRQLALGLPTKMRHAIPLVNALIDQGRLQDARQTWLQALRATNWPRNSSTSESLVFNGGFEHRIANGGFGWRENPVSDARFAIDSHIAHSGSRSLRIEFKGKANLNFQNVFQLVPAEPRTQYHFSAYLRTERLSTDHGIRFEIFDPRHSSSVRILTPNMIGTNPWTRVQVEFTTGPDTTMLEIVLRRTPTWKFDNKIRGTVWIDDVSLAQIHPNAKGALK